MLLKGIVSSVNIENNTAEVILVEHDNQITSPLPIYRRRAEALCVGEFVVIGVFDDTDILNGVIL